LLEKDNNIASPQSVTQFLSMGDLTEKNIELHG
jgi:hypothetical protein